MLASMAQKKQVLDTTARAKEKQLSREADERAIASGEKSQNQIRRENGFFAFPKVRIHIDPKSLV
jgi:hypothetical protein